MNKIKHIKHNIYLNAKEHLKNSKKIPPNAKMIIYTEEEVIVDVDMKAKEKDKLDALDEINRNLLLLRSDLKEFKETTNKRFDKIEKENRARFDKIDTRLDKVERDISEIKDRVDYIVKANNLKDKKDK